MMDIKQFKSAVKQIKVTGAKLDQLIHEAGVFAVYHSIKDGQITPAIDLVAAMPRSSRKERLIVWLCDFGAIKYNKKDGIKYIKGRFEQTEEAAKVQSDIANQIPFWEYGNEENDEADLKAMDFQDKLIALLHQAKAAQLGRNPHYSGVSHTDLITKVRDLLPGDVLTKIDTFKDDNKVVNIVPAVRAEDTRLAA